MPQKIKIAFDISHKPRGKINDNYSELYKLLIDNDFVCEEYFETSITEESLKAYDILVFSCPDFSKISHQEILEIENWVKRDGGGLLLLSHAGGDKGRNSNLSELAELFGITFENDQVLDAENNFGLENLPIMSNFIPPHPINRDINNLCYRAGCSLTIIGGAIPIANSNESSDPFSTPLICVSEPENGRVCCCGSYEIFRNKIGGGISYETHSKLALNIFNWLISDYRFESQLTSTHKSEESHPDISLNNQIEIENKINESIPFETTALEFDTELNFSNKNELMNFLKKLLNQVNGMKIIIEKLIHFSTSSDDLFKKITSEKSQLKKSQLKTNQVKTTIKIPKGTKKDNLHNELHSLERKFSSMENLLNFIKKNYKSGKMDAKTYDKQNAKLSLEIETIKERIQEIKHTLKVET
ncbi:MAG: hypothetical protein KGD57_04330 [Candidatus Lokiarchaeota archaeon]|nr:hypothetical protein [Candidatus Lokiarchaeota archaeon]